MGGGGDSYLSTVMQLAYSTFFSQLSYLIQGMHLKLIYLISFENNSITH